jgi:hypothetical protein
MKHKETNAWTLERYILNELPTRRMKEINQQLKEYPGLRAAVEKLRNSNNDILNQYPPDSIVPQILSQYKIEKGRKEQVTPTRPVFFRRLLAASPAFAIALVLFFILFPFQKDRGDLTKPMTPSDGTRPKGEQTFDMTKPNLLIFRKKNDKVELLENRVKAKAGDLLQIAYITANEKYGVILSIDGYGTVTLHHPDRNDQSTILKDKKKVYLSSSYELDDAPGFERFFFITSMSEINVEDVIQKARKLAHDIQRAKADYIELQGSFKQTSVLILKGEKNEKKGKFN